MRHLAIVNDYPSQRYFKAVMVKRRLARQVRNYPKNFGKKQEHTQDEDRWPPDDSASYSLSPCGQRCAILRGTGSKEFSGFAIDPLIPRLGAVVEEQSKHQSVGH